MPQVDLVVTDLDGTLWSTPEAPHERTVEAWRELQRRDIPVLVATGRRVTSTRESLGRLSFVPPAVVMNGALVLDLATGDRYHCQCYETADAVAVLRAFRAAGLDPCVYIDHPELDVFLSAEPSTHPEHVAGFGAKAAVDDLDTIVETVPVLMFGIMGHPAAPLQDVAVALEGVAETHLSPDEWGAHTFTVTPRGLSKWIGVTAYCAHAGLDSSRVLAIGDGPNDCELLTNAAISVSPEDGHERALACAQHTVPSPRDGGWAAILDLV